MKNFLIIVAVLLLITAFANLHAGYSYYQILRWMVTICAGLFCFNCYNKNTTLFIVFFIIAILFNPVVPIYLDKDVWRIIDIITAIIFFIYAIKNKNKKV